MNTIISTVGLFLSKSCDMYTIIITVELLYKYWYIYSSQHCGIPWALRENSPSTSPLKVRTSLQKEPAGPRMCVTKGK